MQLHKKSKVVLLQTVFGFHWQRYKNSERFGCRSTFGSCTILPSLLPLRQARDLEIADCYRFANTFAAAYVSNPACSQNAFYDLLFWAPNIAQKSLTTSPKLAPALLIFSSDPLSLSALAHQSCPHWSLNCCQKSLLRSSPNKQSASSEIVRSILFLLLDRAICKKTSLRITECFK